MNEKRVQKNICTNDGGIILKTKEKVRKYKKQKMYRSDTNIQMNLENTKDKNIKLKLVDIYKVCN